MQNESELDCENANATLQVYNPYGYTKQKEREKALPPQIFSSVSDGASDTKAVLSELELNFGDNGRVILRRRRKVTRVGVGVEYPDGSFFVRQQRIRDGVDGYMSRLYYDCRRTGLNLVATVDCAILC